MMRRQDNVASRLGMNGAIVAFAGTGNKRLTGLGGQLKTGH
jgi:hypothetical protein